MFESFLQETKKESYLANLDSTDGQWTYTWSTRPRVLIDGELRGCCYDCRLPYFKFEDLVIPDYKWKLISPRSDDSDCGLLCPTCIVSRCGVLNVELSVN